MRQIFTTLLIALTFQFNASSQVFWEDDFSNPGNWYIVSYAPNNFEWSIGTSTDTYMGAFSSTTADNGYALFDTDLDPDSMNSIIMTNNLIPVKAGLPVHLTFEQYYKNWIGNDEYTYACIFTQSDQQWHFIRVNESFVQNDVTTNSSYEDFDISSYITQDDSIYVAFYYISSTGYNYGWYIDDVSLYYDLPNNDVKVTNILTLGKLPIGYGTPHSVKAIIQNAGGSVQSNVQVKLEVTGDNAFTDTQTISTLGVGESDTVTFLGYTPSKLGVNTIKVSVPADNVNDNNVVVRRQEVTYNTFSYADTSAVSNSYGISDGSGMTLVKFNVNSPKSVKFVNVFLYDSKSIAKTVYGVLLDKDGKQITRSKDYVILSSDLGKYHSFEMDSFPILDSTDFYVGLAQLEAGLAYWPVGVQEETENNVEANYWAGDLVPTTLVEHSGISFRAMIEAVMGDAPPKVCLVTTDMQTDKNVVVWEKVKSGSISKYNIYRETNVANSYEKIGEVPYNDLSVFTDPTAVPGKRQYSYKITMVDTMNIESEKSPYHKTLLLQFNGGLDLGVVNLSWQNYEVEGNTLQFDSYVIYKNSGNDSVNLIAVDTVPGNIKAFVDKDVNATKVRTFYRIAGLLHEPCNPEEVVTLKQAGIRSGGLKSGGGVYVQSVSNMEDNRLRTTNINNSQGMKYNFLCYPNPFSEMAKISYNLPSASNVSISIADATGRTVLVLAKNEQQIAGVHNYQLKSSSLVNLSKGIYFVKFSTNDAQVTRQLVKIE